MGSTNLVNDRIPYDMIVIGAGPAGCTIATLLSKAGWKTAIVDRKTLPIQKLCGEFLSPEAGPILNELDLNSRIRKYAPEIRTATIHTGKGPGARFPLPDPGWGIGRTSLDRILIERARTAGVRVLLDRKVTEIDPPFSSSDDPSASITIQQITAGSHSESILESSLIAGAWGKRSGLDQFFQRPFLQRTSGYAGFSKHFVRKGKEQSQNRIELYTFPSGYCGFLPIQGGQWNLCALCKPSVLDEMPQVSWSRIRSRLLEHNPVLRERLNAFQPAENKMRTVGQVYTGPKQLNQVPLPLLGDAAGLIPPYTGFGQTMAMAAGQMLANFLKKKGRPQSRKAYHSMLESWRQNWRNRYRRNTAIINENLHSLLLNQSRASAITRLLHVCPRIGTALYSLTRA